MATDVGLRVDEMSIVELLKLLLLLVWEDYVAAEGLRHQQVFTKGSRTLAQHLIRVGGDDSAEGENEVVDHLLVQEVGGNSIRDGVLGKFLGSFLGVRHHQLWLQFHRIIAEFSLGHCLQAMRALWKVGVTLHPVEAIHVHIESPHEFIHGVYGKTNFIL